MMLLSGIGIQTSAQIQITGKIYNSDTKELLPYVSLGIEAKATGTVSDRNGSFLLRLGEGILDSDSVTFSHIGFSSIKYRVSDLSENENVIYLKPKEFELAEISITAPKLRDRRLGRTTAGTGLVHVTFFTRDELGIEEQLSSEIGTLLRLRNDCIVNSANFNISSNRYEYLKFRLTFYSVEEGLPKDIIVDQDIIFDVTDRYIGWFNLDLKPYEIFITGHEHIAVTLTLLEDDEKTNERKFFMITGAMIPYRTSYRRIRAMDEWNSHDAAISFYLEVTEYRK